MDLLHEKGIEFSKSNDVRIAKILGLDKILELSKNLKFIMIYLNYYLFL